MTKRTSRKPSVATDAAGEMHCTCALIRRSARQITQTYDAALKDTGLRITQYSILANLYRQKSLSITELANAMVIDRTTLTRNLRPLQRDGLVELSDGPDKRSRALTLTDEGRNLFKTARPLWRKTERKVRQGIDSEELARLRQLLAQVAPTG